MAPSKSKKRKRRASARENVCEQPARSARKKVQHEDPQDGEAVETGKIEHAVLSHYYPEIVTLRQYVLAKLPDSSKIRRKKLSAVGAESSSARAEIPDVERSVGTLLDTTLIGLRADANSVEDNRVEKWTTFSQRGDESYITLSDGLTGSVFSQSEIIDFVIWLLFSKEKTSGIWPKHMLCDGFRRTNAPRPQAQTNIPGLYSVYVNHQVNTLKQAPWPELLKLLGSCGDSIMIDLLLDCAIFVYVNAGQGNYQQISGVPLFDSDPWKQGGNQDGPGDDIDRSPSDISFMRNRMLYARAALNARGLVQFGFRHIHVLNRAPYCQLDDETCGEEHDRLAKQNRINTVKIMMHMFPRQFGLHNAFTSKTNFTETSQRLQDYTFREDEISKKFGSVSPDQNFAKNSTPKRLRGKTTELVQNLQVLHTRCSYSKLLEHYCPLPVSPKKSDISQSHKGPSQRVSGVSDSKGVKTTAQFYTILKSSETHRASSLMDLATPTASVSAFCQAVVSKIVPNAFLGSDTIRQHNKKVILKKIDQFIRLRRFESLSLHEVVQGMKITDIEWLAHSRLITHKTSRTDIKKRTELFNEFLYYVFDSLVIPLLRSNFYITESNVHKYRLFFFRHDVWRHVAEPAMSTLKSNMFEEVNLNDVNRILEHRRLGFSQVRLLPKETGVRPIMNLRRRTVMKNNKRVLGPSINSVLRPVHNVLQLEKSMNPSKLGATMFSVGDIYKRIKTFKSRMGASSCPYYFAKVDVQKAFDTIPQASIVGLLNSIPQQREYRISKHAEIGINRLGTSGDSKATKSKPLRKWHSIATTSRDSLTFLKFLEQKQAANKRNTVFIESVVKRKYETSDLLKLVASHIQQNLVKIGKKFYRQKEGIPQGSVLSSTLCNYFYADLELHLLKFLDSDDCVLLRLIDDFLLITTDRDKAAQFVETMHQGVPGYGVTVNPKKSLVNFDLETNGKTVSKVSPAGGGFPYCGTLIDCQSLDMTCDREERNKDKAKHNMAIFNSLTVELTRAPGQTFQRKTMHAFKIQSHLMFFDTSLNSAKTMLGNIFTAFCETAAKMWAYIRCLPKPKQPAPGLVVSTIGNLVDAAYLLLISKARKLRYPGYQCDVRKTEVAYLAYAAFRKVLAAKQAKFGDVLLSLEAEIGKLRLTKKVRLGRVGRVRVT